MPNFPPLPAYPYAPKAPFPHGDANEASEDLVKTHNADEGSSHAPTGTSAWSGSMGFGWTFADLFPFAGEVDVTAGLTFAAPTAGSITYANEIAIALNGATTVSVATPGDTVFIAFDADTFLILNASSTMMAAAGSLVTLAGTTNLSGTTSITGAATVSGSGSLTVAAGRVLTVNGSLVIGASGGVTYGVGATVSGAVEDHSFITRVGSGAGTAHRAATVLTDADADMTIANDRYQLPTTQAGNRVFTLRHTGFVPVIGQRIKVTRIFTGAPSAHTAKMVREDATILFSFYNSMAGFAEFEFTAGGWIPIEGIQTAVSASGYYDQ